MVSETHYSECNSGFEWIPYSPITDYLDPEGLGVGMQHIMLSVRSLCTQLLSEDDDGESWERVATGLLESLNPEALLPA